MSNLFFRKPRLLALTVVLILVSGLSALKVLPRAEDPELVGRNATVFTLYPGASAERVEALVTERIEDALRELEQIHLLTSSSRAGISTVAIELDEAITAVDEVWARVRDELADVEPELPRGAHPPVFEEFTITAYTLISGLTWDLESPPNRAILRRLAEDLADELRALPGTEDADLFGDAEEEVLVEVDPSRLAAEGLSVTDVARAVERGDSKAPAGELRGVTELLIEVEGEIDSLARVQELVVQRGDDGRVVRVGDLGEVRKHFAEPASDLALIAGEPGVVVAARMLPGRRVDRWTAAAHERLGAFADGLPRGVRLSVLFDQSRYTEERLSNLFGNFVLGAGLVMVVVLLLMGWRSALLVGTALPLTTLMVLAAMNAMGIPMNQMSIAGLIIALGLLIDNAIVVVDEVRQQLAEHRNVANAVGTAVRSLAVPLLGSTVTTALAFMPIVLMPGAPGEFVGSMALSVILAISSSLFLAMTVVPALTGLVERLGRGRASARACCIAASRASASPPATGGSWPACSRTHLWPWPWRCSCRCSVSSRARPSRSSSSRPRSATSSSSSSSSRALPRSSKRARPRWRRAR